MHVFQRKNEKALCSIENPDAFILQLIKYVPFHTTFLYNIRFIHKEDLVGT